MLARQCHSVSLWLAPPEILSIEVMYSQNEEKIMRAESMEELSHIFLDEQNLEKFVKINSRLNSKVADELMKTLQQNTDIFAWSAVDMLRISPNVITHRLNVSSSYHPIKQKKRYFALEQSRAMREEVTKLTEADLIHEVHYPEWLTNVVLVKKANEKWRIYVDYTDLNKAFPKDSYLLLSIDQLVDATSGFHVMSFMDAFSGYNQIQMAEKDKEKTAFITDRGTYCYKVISFGLKNAGATYQRMVNEVFKT